MQKTNNVKYFKKRRQPLPSIAAPSDASNKDMVHDKKVLVVGAGCGGLGAAWHLHRSGIDVTVYEAAERIGGHANTISVDGVPVDTGFMVYNSLNYPNLCSFFRELGIEGTETTMGFSVSANEGKFEWCSDSLAGLLSSPLNLINPQFYSMVRDIFTFNVTAKAFLDLPDEDCTKSMTTGEFLSTNGLSDSFRDYYLIPMTAAIWSATSEDMLDFPAVSLFTFLDNHLLLQVTENVTWMTPSKRSQEYVTKVGEELGDRIHVNKHIAKIERTCVEAKAAHNRGEYKIKVIDHEGVEATFDEIVFACHPDQALQLLGNGASMEEMKYLSEFHYANNDTYVHSDELLMPKARSAWTCWNYICPSHQQQKEAASPFEEGTSNKKPGRKPVFVTYWLNKLQKLNHPRPVFVTLNPDPPPAPEKTHARIQYAHPQYTAAAVQAQRSVAAILQGARGTYFCGAWMGYGFHEDGFRSGLEVAVAISGVPLPWAHSHPPAPAVPPPPIPTAAAGIIRPSTGSTGGGNATHADQLKAVSSDTVTKIEDEDGGDFSLPAPVPVPVGKSRSDKSGLHTGNQSQIAARSSCNRDNTVSNFLWRSLTNLIISPAIKTLGSFCEREIITFLGAAFQRGNLVIWLPDKSCYYISAPTDRSVAASAAAATVPADDDAQKDGLSTGTETSSVSSMRIITSSTSSSMYQSEESPVNILVHDKWFFVRLALEADLGLAYSYIAGEWDVAASSTATSRYRHQQQDSVLDNVTSVRNDNKNEDALVQFLLLLIDNMPSGKTHVRGGLDARNMVTAWVGSTLNFLWYYLAKDNSIANSRSNISAHYDLSNDLFETFLDKDYMMYSSAIFETKVVLSSASTSASASAAGGRDEEAGEGEGVSVVHFVDTLEVAQLRKIDLLLARLEPISTDTTLLDIGFGWGGVGIRAAEKYGCKVTGITLSIEQKTLAEERVRAKGLEHLIHFELVDYRVFASRGLKFDRIVSCEMIEAVGHHHLGSFFEAVDRLLRTDGIFVMQAITMPDSRYEAYKHSVDFINTVIFPGGHCPSLTALMKAMAARSSMHVDQVSNYGLHYAETLRRWRWRFNSSLRQVYGLGFDDTFVRLWNLYFCYCEAGFEAQILNLQIITFSRPGNANMVRAQIPPVSLYGL